MNEDNECYGAPNQDYANCTYEYFVVNNLETIANGYNGQQN